VKVRGSSPLPPTVFNLEILYEDGDVLAVNKPAGVLVHQSASSGGERTITDWLVKNRPGVQAVGDNPELRPGIVHRLDRETSGVLLIAKTPRYFDYLKALFQGRRIKKTYLALVYGRVRAASGRIEKPIGLRSGSVKRTVVTARAKMVKNAVTAYRVKGYANFVSPAGSEECTVLEVVPQTGRTHQIRVHLASIGHPVVGDALYGGKRGAESTRLRLHAYSLEFPLSPGRQIKIAADPPPDFYLDFTLTAPYTPPDD
jgi:23S rRNA pseudouridine1911/1915/1917 synthase